MPPAPTATNFVPPQTIWRNVCGIARAVQVIPSGEVAQPVSPPIAQNTVPFHAIEVHMPASRGRSVHVIPSGEVAARLVGIGSHHVGDAAVGQPDVAQQDQFAGSCRRVDQPNGLGVVTLPPIRQHAL